MRFKRILSAACSFLLIFSVLTIPVYAESADETEKWSASKAVYTKLYADCPDCNYVRSGGVNRLDGIEAESRAETQALEDHLLSNGYVLASTSRRDISETDAELLKTVRFVGSSYLGDEPYYSDYQYFRVYVYRPTLETAREQWEENGCLDLHCIWEIHTSSVLIDYECWYESEKVGTVLGGEEINGQMPVQYEFLAGFVEFDSPINAEIQLHLKNGNYDYLLYIPKGKTLMKLRADHYTIVRINSDELEYGDELLTNKNYLNVYKQPEDAPIQVSLDKVVKRDRIESIDLTGKPNCAWGAVYEPVDIQDNGDVTVDDAKELTFDAPDEGEKKAPASQAFARKVLLVLLPLCAVGVLVFIIRTKRNGRKGD